MTLPRWILAALACVMSGNVARADYAPADLPKIGSVAAVTAGHLTQYKQFYLSNYGNGTLTTGDGGEGTFSQVTSCTDDAGFSCIHDADGIAFQRANVTGDLRHAGLTQGSVYDAMANPTTVQSASTIIANDFVTLNAYGLYNLHTNGIDLKIGTSITVPPNSSLQCDIVPDVLSAASYNDVPGVLYLDHGATLIAGGSAGSGGPAQQCNIIPYWYLNPAAATFTNGNTNFQVPPATYKDIDAIRQNMIAAGDTAIQCGQNNCAPHDDLIVGFDTGLYLTKAAHLDVQHVTIDANVCVYGSSGGGQTDFFGVDCEPVITKGGIANEEYWHVGSFVPSTHNVNSLGHPVCEATLSHGIDATGAATPWDTRDILNSTLDSHGNAISYVVWIANGTNTNGDNYGCNGRWPAKVISYGGGSGSASTAVVDLLESDFGHASGGGSTITIKAQWASNSNIIYVHDTTCGMPSLCAAGQIITSIGTGFPSGTVKVLAVLHGKGPDPYDPYQAELLISAPTTAAQATDVSAVLDNGVYTVPSSTCNGGKTQTCFFLNGAERVYSGNSVGGVASQKIPIAFGNQVAAGFFFDGVAGPRGSNTFCFGHDICIAIHESQSTDIVQEGGDDNGELDDPYRVHVSVSGGSQNTDIVTNKGSKSGVSYLNDDYDVENATANTTTTGLNALGTGTGTIVVASTTGFKTGAGGTVLLCSDNPCATSSTSEIVNYSVVDGTHLKINQRGIFGSIATTFSAGTDYLTDQAVSSHKGCLDVIGTGSAVTTGFLIHSETLHGCTELMNERTNGSGYTFLSHNTTFAQFLANAEPQDVMYFEDEAARNATFGAANMCGADCPQALFPPQASGSAQALGAINALGTSTGNVTGSDFSKWPPIGVLFTDGEYIGYSVTDSTDLSLNKRGMCGTAASTHSNGVSAIYMNATIGCGIVTPPNMALYGDGGVTFGNPTGGDAGIGIVNAKGYQVDSLAIYNVPAYGTTGSLTTNNQHAVTGSVNLIAGAGTVNLSGAAVFTNSGTYACFANDTTAANAVTIRGVSGSQFTLTGTGTDSISFRCTGN